MTRHLKKISLRTAIILISITIFFLFILNNQKRGNPIAANLKPVYKILTVDQWAETNNKQYIQRGEFDSAFIHFATKKQVPGVISRFFKGKTVIVLELDPKKLIGNLIFEKNPGGSEQYPHLYDGRIPTDAILKVETVQPE